SSLDVIETTEAHCGGRFALVAFRRLPKYPPRRTRLSRPAHPQELSCPEVVKIMPKFTHHIFVCTNQRPPESPKGCCDPTRSGMLHLAFKKEVAARGLKAQVRANRAGCLDQCEHGPTVVIYPDAVWYGGVR